MSRSLASKAAMFEFSKSERLVDFLCSRLPMNHHVLPDVRYLDEKLKLKYGPNSKVCKFLVGSSWDGLPSLVDPAYHLPESRKLRKRQQLMSIFRAVAPLLLCAIKEQRPLKLVDFCGGGGHVGLLLAFLFPDVEVICVDKNVRGLELGVQRAKDLSLSNYRTVEGEVMEFDEAFDVGVSLHACGAATDMVISKCLTHSVPLVVSSCCVGKIGLTSFATLCMSGYPSEQPVWDEAKGSNMRELLREYASLHGENGDNEHTLFVRLSKAADYSKVEFTSMTIHRMFAKLLIELDRLDGIRELSANTDSRFDGRICKMEPLTATPKNDILIAWPESVAVDVESYRLSEDPLTGQNLATVRTEMEACDECKITGLAEIRQKLVAFKDDPSQSCLTLEDVSGSQARKLVHSEAERLGLLHASEGKGKARKVIVRKPETQSPCS